MTDSFYYNQEVTAQMINDIAIDLGYTSFNGFGTEKFGVADLNNITRDIVSKGILQTDEKCRAVYTDGVIYIQPGAIVFEDGAKKRIENAITFTSRDSGVIYALNDTAAGKASIIYGDAYPESGDFVKICKVTASGVADDREFAEAKIKLASGNLYNESALNTFAIEDGQEITAYTIDVAELEKYRYIYLKQSGLVSDSAVSIEDFRNKTGEWEEIYEHTNNAGNTSRLSRGFFTNDEKTAYSVKYRYYHTIEGRAAKITVGYVLM